MSIFQNEFLSLKKKFIKLIILSKKETSIKCTNDQLKQLPTENISNCQASIFLNNAASEVKFKNQIKLLIF